MYHFIRRNWKLRNGDGRTVEPGVPITLPLGHVTVGKFGLHAAPRLAGALRYAYGEILTRVELSGTVEAKPLGAYLIYAASERTVVASTDARRLLAQVWGAMNAIRYGKMEYILRNFYEETHDLAADEIILYTLKRWLHEYPADPKIWDEDSLTRSIRSFSEYHTETLDRLGYLYLFEQQLEWTRYDSL